jgi:hypothetical protein
MEHQLLLVCCNYAVLLTFNQLAVLVHSVSGLAQVLRGSWVAPCCSSAAIQQTPWAWHVPWCPLPSTWAPGLGGSGLNPTLPEPPPPCGVVGRRTPAGSDAGLGVRRADFGVCSSRNE